MEKVLEANELLQFAIQIVRGMTHLEQRQLIHRDLAARNILIDRSKTLKISDFGMSRQTEVYVVTRNNARSCQRKVPLRWMPPEAITNGEYSSSSDVWSFAVVLWELGTLGAFPYTNISNERVLTYLLEGGRLHVPPTCTPRLRELILQCWQLDPANRPTFCHLLVELEKMQAPPHEQLSRAYVNFELLNPSYDFPSTQQQ